MKVDNSVAMEWPSHFSHRQDVNSERRKELLRRSRLARRDLRYMQPKSQDLDMLFQNQIPSLDEIPYYGR